VIFFALNGFTMHLSWYSIVMAAALAIVGMAYTLFGFRILKSGSMALYTLFLMSGGMAVPYVWGLCFLGEDFSILRTLGLAVLIAAVLFSNMPRRGDRVNVKLILMCCAVFALNGCVSVLSKVHQVEAVLPTVNTTEFVVLSGIFKVLIAGVAWVVAGVMEKRAGVASTAKPRTYVVLPLIVLSALIGGGSYLLQLIGAANLPATVLYPFITGGSMIFSTVVGILLFREKPSRNLILGVLLCFVGTLMFL
jgi:drug/metabolite transporter (DMT)-like permease